MPLWEASDRLCGKRLQALQPLQPLLVDSLESHGHLSLEGTVREQLLAMSSATIDRLLSPIRKASAGNGWRRTSPGAGAHIQGMGGPPRSGLAGDRPGGPLRRADGGPVPVDVDGHRHCHRLERKPADRDARRSGGAAGSAAGHRCRQRPGVHEQPDGGLVQPAWSRGRAHPLQGLQEQQPSMGRTEERHAGASGGGLPAAGGPGGGPGAGGAVRGPATVYKTVPAVVQAQEQ